MSAGNDESRISHVALLAIPGALGSSLTIPLEMLNAARDIARVRREPGQDLQLSVVGLDLAPVKLSGGLQVSPDTVIAEAPHSQLIFIPGLWRSPYKTVQQFPALLPWLKTMHQGGTLLCSITTGSYIPAAAGLLDNLPATTHWYFFDDFHQHYPQVKLQRRRFITLANRIYCTGSVNAARDVILHLLERIFSPQVVNEVARHFTHEIKRSYESLLLDEQQQDTHHDELIIKVQEWLQAHYQQEISLPEVAAHFQLSVRSLNRRFRAAANIAPLQYLQEIRIEHAKGLLKQSNLSIAEVCYQVGYHDHSYFGGLFKKLNKVTPVQYRNLVRTKLFRVADN